MVQIVDKKLIYVCMIVRENNYILKMYKKKLTLVLGDCLDCLKLKKPYTRGFINEFAHANIYNNLLNLKSALLKDSLSDKNL